MKIFFLGIFSADCLFFSPDLTSGGSLACLPIPGDPRCELGPGWTPTLSMTVTMALHLIFMKVPVREVAVPT